MAPRRSTTTESSFILDAALRDARRSCVLTKGKTNFSKDLNFVDFNVVKGIELDQMCWKILSGSIP
jgi:hypothetical protein